MSLSVTECHMRAHCGRIAVEARLVRNLKRPPLHLTRREPIGVILRPSVACRRPLSIATSPGDLVTTSPLVLLQRPLCGLAEFTKWSSTVFFTCVMAWPFLSCTVSTDSLLVVGKWIVLRGGHRCYLPAVFVLFRQPNVYLRWRQIILRGVVHQFAKHGTTLVDA